MDDLDVLIVNPGKVETGLDLVRLATAVFYEVEYSLPRWQQALGRLHRLGQTQAVKGVYVAYRGTMEEQALGLMGAKKKAQLLLYGENAYSAIAEEAEDDNGDFLRDLAGRVLAGEDLSDGLAGLVTDTQTTTRAWGSYTQQSVVLNSWDDFARRHGFGNLADFLQAQRLRGRRKAVAVERKRQPALW